MTCSKSRGPIPSRAADDIGPEPYCSETYCASSMSRVARSTVKRLAQKLLGQNDVRGFGRQQKLCVSKKIYRRPTSIAELRRELIDLGLTPGRTLCVQYSSNEVYNVPL